MTRFLFYSFFAFTLLGCDNQSKIVDNQQDLIIFSDVKPGTYQGILPCTDCDGILTIVQLAENGVAIVSNVYLGKEETPHIQFGLVEFFDKEAIAQGKDFNIKFKGIKEGILLLNQQGNTIDLDSNYFLETTSEKIVLSEPFYAKERYFYMADAHVMWLGSATYPVIMNKLNFEVEKKFLQSSEESKDNFYISVKARIVNALSMDDQYRDHIEILEIISTNVK